MILFRAQAILASNISEVLEHSFQQLIARMLSCVRLMSVSGTSNLLAQMFDLPKMHKSPPDVDFESSRSLAKSES